MNRKIMRLRVIATLGLSVLLPITYVSANSGGTVIDTTAAYYEGTYYAGYFVNAPGNITGQHVIVDQDISHSTKASSDINVVGAVVSQGSTYENTVDISDGNLYEVYGGIIMWSGESKDNIVNVSGGHLVSVVGGHAGPGNANHNTVNISGGTHY